VIVLFLPAAESAADPSVTGLSAFSSASHTLTWSDSLRVHLGDPARLSWDFAQRLDLLRKELSGGTDLRQKGHHALLTARSPETHPCRLKIDLEGEQRSFVETLNRQTLWSRFLAGGLWRAPGQTTLEAQLGWTASRHRAGDNRADDGGFARRLGAKWGAIRRGGPSARLKTSIQLLHEGDNRTHLPSNETKWSWQTDWAQPSDSVFLEWEEQRGDSRFYPSRDRFDQIGRQEKLYRLAHGRWSHASSGDSGKALMRIVRAVTWRADALISLDQNIYHVSQSVGGLGVVPGDVRTARRSYSLGATSSLGPFGFVIDYRYRWVEDRFREVRRDQTAETGELDAGLTHRLTPADSLGVHAIFRVTSYTIPVSGAFFDDRDQAERVVELFWRRQFAPGLVFRPEFSFQRQHQVILSAEESANNNTNDVYVLEPRVEWRPSRAITLLQTFSIRAHYRYLDFKPATDQGHGTLYRRAESATDTRLTQTRRTAWTIRYVYRYEDFGGLYDRGGWVQAVDWDRRSHLLDCRLIWRPWKTVSIEPGMGLEYKHSYNHRREGTGVRRIADKPFWRRQVLLNAQWQSRFGYNIRLSVARRVQDSGLGVRDLDNRWELGMSKDL